MVTAQFSKKGKKSEEFLCGIRLQKPGKYNKIK